MQDKSFPINYKAKSGKGKVIVCEADHSIVEEKIAEP